MQIFPVFLPHRGCPHRCSFCDQVRTTQRWQAPSPQEVTSFLEVTLPERGQGEVAFYGGTFSLLPAEEQGAYLKAVQPFIDRGQVSGVRISTRPDALGDEVVARLLAGGVRTVEVGCQSFDEEVLRRCGRGHGAAVIGEAIGRLRSAGLQVGVQLMPGLPGGDRREAHASLEAALALGADFLRLYPAVVFPGTPLADDYDRGAYRPWSLDEAVQVCCELWLRCRRAKVPVIRMGLQDNEALRGEQGILAGPYHPAFGQLVRSRAWLLVLERGLAAGQGWRVEVHPADLSDVLGHRKENLERLRSRCGHLRVDVNPHLPRESAGIDGEVFSLLELCANE